MRTPSSRSLNAPTGSGNRAAANPSPASTGSADRGSIRASDAPLRVFQGGQPARREQPNGHPEAPAQRRRQPPTLFEQPPGPGGLEPHEGHEPLVADAGEQIGLRVPEPVQVLLREVDASAGAVL